jgi:hypothetical protein
MWSPNASVQNAKSTAKLTTHSAKLARQPAVLVKTPAFFAPYRGIFGSKPRLCGQICRKERSKIRNNGCEDSLSI